MDPFVVHIQNQRLQPSSAMVPLSNLELNLPITAIILIFVSEPLPGGIDLRCFV
jgi:hypothetical protein